MNRVVVIGAGVGGLTVAARLAQAGLNVTVLEAHVYPGGCAGTFYHQGYHFDAGATLAGGFYPGGPMDVVAQTIGLDSWPANPSEPAAMQVHLPDGATVTRWIDDTRWHEHRAAFGPHAEAFFRWQERTANALWNFALKTPSWPPQTLTDLTQLTHTGLSWLSAGQVASHLPHLLADAFRPVAAHLRHAPERLRLFVDGQLLIAAQATSHSTNALYGAAALDLPRRGIVHLSGGMGAIAQTLAQVVRQNGGQVHYRQEASRIVIEQSHPVAVETKRAKSFPADLVIANLTPWNLARLLGDHLPPKLRPYVDSSPQHMDSFDGWGAGMLYVGLDESVIPANFPLHHQVIVREPLAEGNTIFLSLSPAWDKHRAPAGRRALTISTHTRLSEWWRLFEDNRSTYEIRKNELAQRLLTAAEVALPGLRKAAQLILPGTPVTFQRFTRRLGGWVGGFPQTSLFRAWGPRLGPGLWLVGDSIFPGQSTAAVALGGLRVAGGILAELGSPSPAPATDRTTRVRPNLGDVRI